MLCKEIHSFWLPKRGNTREEYEDAASGDTERGRFALADGASESSYAGPWARLLVEGFLHAPNAELSAWIVPLRDRWLKGLGAGPFPWYTETKIEQGAFATFLGLRLAKKKKCCKDVVVWNAIAVGDSCVFHVRAGQTIRRFPLERREDFDNSPGLLCSRSSRDANPMVRTTRDKVCRPGDKLWLMTDALALWFLGKESAGKKPWEELEPLLQWPDNDSAFATWNEPRRETRESRNSAFAAWIGQRRDSLELRNDDVTLLAICF